MERIMYRKTLDVHKSGVQFTLQGFDTADRMSRKIALSLMASGDTIDLPLEQITAAMYVTTPNAAEPSIHECTIKDNTIIYDVLPIAEEGITEMQLKLIETRPNGARGVLPSPKFAVEVSKSNTDDESAIHSTTYTALETALAQAKGVYDARFVRMEIDSDCMFRVFFADGTTYETDVLKETLLKGEALMSQSYARGGTGLRDGEDADNSMYYSAVSRSAAVEASKTSTKATELLREVEGHTVYTTFAIDFETGEIKYVSQNFEFNVNKESGELEAIGAANDFDNLIREVVTDWFYGKGVDVGTLIPQVEGIWESLGSHVTNHVYGMRGIGEENNCWYICNADGTDENEWINPPMLPNVEYRTTERFYGHPVYVMNVSAGIDLYYMVGANNTYMTDEVEFNTNDKNVLDISGAYYGFGANPKQMKKIGNGDVNVCFTEDGRIGIVNNTNAIVEVSSLIIKYIKH